MNLWIALDVASREAAEAWMARLPRHRTYKVGMELFYRVGPDTIRQWTRQGYRIFLDLKLLDIPRTVAGAVASLSQLDIDLLTVHVGGGGSMLEAARAAAPDLSIVGVTLLTSLGESDLPALGFALAADALVQAYARIAQSAGLQGVVASSADVLTIRRNWPAGRVVVPGIRWAGDAVQDQKRVGDPGMVAQNGATDLVLGRIVTEAADPQAALATIVQAIMSKGVE